MADIITDELHDLEVREDEGVVVFMRRSYIVRVLAGGGIQNFAQALSTAGVPKAGSQTSRYPNLILKERNCSLVNNDPEYVRIELVYVGKGIDEQVGFFVPRTSLKQVATQNDRFGNQITLTHTFPSDHDTFPSQTITQGVEVSTLTPLVDINRTRTLNITNMTTFAQSWNGTINSNVWGGDPPGTWLCTSVTGKLLDGSNPNRGKYKVDFTFQYDPRGHNPFVVYIDSTTGRPPKNISPGTGSKTVDWYKPRNFDVGFFEV